MSLTNPNFYEFAPTLDGLFQQGFVARQIEEGLDTEQAFRRQSTEENLPGRLGTQISIPKTGRKGPVTVPMNPATSAANLDNGLTPSTAPAETYAMNITEWGDTTDVDLVGSLAACADLVTVASRNNGVQAAQSMERLAKLQLHGNYDTANTWVRGDLGGTSISQVHVDDIRGFIVNQSNGQLLPVTSGNPLPCVEVKTGPNGFSQTFNVIGYVADATNQSLYPSSSEVAGVPQSDGVSGYLLISGATQAPVAGDAIISSAAPKIIRPGNKYSDNVLNSSDVMTLQLLLAAVARLRSNAVPTFPDGTYHFLFDPSVELQLFSDPQFMIMYASRKDVPEYQDARIYRLLNMTFIPTTEAYVQYATPGLGQMVPVRRSIVIGAGALSQGNWEGLEMYQNQDGLTPMGASVLVNCVAQILRPPLDRLGRVLSLTWTWVGCFVCQTDGTCVPNIVPTASSSLYKRAVMIHTAG